MANPATENLSIRHCFDIAFVDISSISTFCRCRYFPQCRQQFDSFQNRQLNESFRHRIDTNSSISKTYLYRFNIQYRQIFATESILNLGIICGWEFSGGV